jgi:mitogen-activated protein kinase kinase 1
MNSDIKPSNLLINSAGVVKISDFGVSGQLAHTLSKKQSWVGTVTYMSPERITGTSYSFDSDIWSLGLTLVECALGKFPYDNRDDKRASTLGFWELMEFIVKQPPPTLPSNKFSREFCSFVEKW